MSRLYFHFGGALRNCCPQKDGLFICHNRIQLLQMKRPFSESSRFVSHSVQSSFTPIIESPDGVVHTSTIFCVFACFLQMSRLFFHFGRALRNCRPQINCLFICHYRIQLLQMERPFPESLTLARSK